MTRPQQTWTPAETHILITSYGRRVPPARIAERLGRPLGSVESKINDLARGGYLTIRRRRKHAGRTWRPGEDAVLFAAIQDGLPAEVGRAVSLCGRVYQTSNPGWTQTTEPQDWQRECGHCYNAKLSIRAGRRSFTVAMTEVPNGN